MNRKALPVLLLLAIAPLTGAAEPTAFDRIQSAYAPYLTPEDPFSLPMKIRSLSSDEYKFWRGSKDLFFQWGKTHCTDWLADPAAFLPNHGDLHLGNIGTYVTEDGLHTLAFGMVDFDDSARLPFEFELVQGLITLDLVARQNKIALSPEQQAQLDQTVFDDYRLAINSRRNATDMLKDDPTVAKLLAKAGKKPYSDDLDKFTSDGKFRRVLKKKDKPATDLLDPIDSTRWDAFAAAIQLAVRNDDRLQKLMPEPELKAIRKKIKDVARRTRLGSSGSQGLDKYLVLLDKPFAGIDHDIILYLKQEIPSAAERSGIISRDARSPGERCASDMDKMTEPRAFISSFTTLGEKSFWVYLKEPWSDELAYDDVKDADQLLRMAHVWATVAGCTHREDGRFEIIQPRLTPALRGQIRQRATAYLAYQHEAFESFKADLRLEPLITTADRAIADREGR